MNLAKFRGCDRAKMRHSRHKGHDRLRQLIPHGFIHKSRPEKPSPFQTTPTHLTAGPRTWSDEAVAAMDFLNPAPEAMRAVARSFDLPHIARTHPGITGRDPMARE